MVTSAFFNRILLFFFLPFWHSLGITHAVRHPFAIVEVVISATANDSIFSLLV
jgi:hypothetical protein